MPRGRVTLQVSGQGRIALSTKDGRLSGEAGRPEALSGVPFTVRYSMVAEPGESPPAAD